MKSKRIWIILAALVCILLIAALAIDHFLNADTYRGRIEAALSQSLNRQVTLGHLSFSIFTGSLDASSLAIADDPSFSRQPFLTAKDIRIGVHIWPLITTHQLHVTGITIDQPSITLLSRANGKWNYSSLGSSAPSPSSSSSKNILPNLTVSRLAIQDGTITIGTQPATAPPHVYDHVNVTASHFSFASAFPFTVSAGLPGGGSMKINGNAGPINSSNAAATPFNAKVTLRNADLAKELLSSNQSIAGTANLDADIVSNGRTATVHGTASVTNLKLARNGTPSSQPVHLKFTIEQYLQALSGTIQKATLSVGQAAMDIHGTYRTQGPTTALNLNASGQGMPIDSLVAFLPSLGVQLPPGSQLQGGTLTTNLNISGSAANPVIAGPVNISNTRLAGFNLGQKLSAIRALSGAGTGSDTTIQTLSTDLKYGPSGTQTSNLNAVVTGLGTATGNGSISPSNQLDYQLTIKLATTGVGGLAQRAASMLPGAFGASVGQSMKNGIPVAIRGTTSHPEFIPDLGNMFNSNNQQQTNTQTQQQKQNPLKKAFGNLFGSGTPQ
ncbi:MAG: AsmA family protein [Acidobacteriaceae bacterium]